MGTAGAGCVHHREQKHVRVRREEGDGPTVAKKVTSHSSADADAPSADADAPPADADDLSFALALALTLALALALACILPLLTIRTRPRRADEVDAIYYPRNCTLPCLLDPLNFC